MKILIGRRLRGKIVDEANSEMVKIMMKVGWSSPAGDAKGQLFRATRP